ncbi:MAG: TlpA family protein disulfide reductase [Cytophagaceae bacterium]|nr:MAG: TlpA family protein disulfide reductase [Cytophagaceae bacterium]
MASIFEELADSTEDVSTVTPLVARYVQAHRASYVALWSLIERFSKFGHSQLREQTVALFASQVKASTPWQVLKTDMQQVLIKQGAPFPSFPVQGVAQNGQLLQLPKAQYTLVDFWFSHCRPCLESFPALKDLYATYQAKGFEIMSISTDPTEDIPLWHKRITAYALPWPQYLDENAVAATKAKVHIFPATFLLDHTGKVLLRDITPEELAKFLATKLGS